MQRYRLPGHEVQLLGELQRQQNSAQFCDTLLQTEGISVPTHSCVLAALSPYLSQKLSATPCPPSGQKRQLQLQAVKPQTLLKLVGLLYSGELEVKGSVEQNDVLAAARQFGMALVEGQKDLQERRQSLGSCSKYCIYAEEDGERAESRKMQDAQVQAEMAQRQDTDYSVEKRNCVSTGTQTVNVGEKAVDSSLTLSNQTEPPTQEHATSVTPNLDFSILLQSQNITLEKRLCSTSSPLISRMPRGASSDGDSTSYQSSDSITNPTPTSQGSNNLTFPVSLNDVFNSPTPEEESAYQQASESVDNIHVLAKERAGLKDRQTNDQVSEKRDDGEVMLSEEKIDSTERRCVNAHAGMKSLANMKQLQQMMETTQISIKVKLRRRPTNGEMWEVVNVQNRDETLSVVTSLTQDRSNHKRPQTELANIQPPPCIAHLCPPQKPDTQIPQPTTTNSPKRPPNPNTSSESQTLSSDYITPNHNGELPSVPLPQPRGPVEESDEQIEKLLEDIMMGLNILPNLERGRKKSHNVSSTHNGAICQVPVTENEEGQMHAAVTAEDYVCYQDFRTHSGYSSTDTVLPSVSTLYFVTPTVSVVPDFNLSPQSKSKSFTILQNSHPNTNHLSFVNSKWTDGHVPTCCTGIHCCFTAQNQPSCTSLSPLPLDAVLIQQQQQQPSPQHHSSAYIGQTDGIMLSKSQNSLYPEAPTTSSVIASALYSTGQEPHYPALQVVSSQEEQNILEFLPVSNGNETLSLHSLSLSCIDDLRLPPCLSPLGANTSAATQPVLNNNTEQQSSRHGRPWLTENPGSLQFPLSAIAQRENKCTSLKKDTNHAHWSMQCPEHLQFKPQHGRTWAESGAENRVGERTVSAGSENAAELKSELKRTKKSLKCKQCEAKDDSVTPKRRKRKHPSEPQDPVGPLMTYPNLKVSEGTNSQINLSVCSVSLSSNNVLAKEREVATRSSNKPSTFGGKPNQQSTITENLKEKTKSPEGCTKLVSTDQTRIRTRGFLRKAQETPSNKSTESSPVPVICGATIVTKPVSPFERKRGRPKKTKLDMMMLNDAPPIIETKSNIGKNEQQTEKDSPEEGLENCEKTKRERKKRKRNRSAEVELIPLKKTISAEGTAEAENNNDIIPAVRKTGTPKQMVSLKEFQKLIKRQHSKTWKSKENSKKNEIVRNKEDKIEACENKVSNFEEDSTKETEMDIDVTQPEDTGEIEETHVTSNVTVDKNHNQIFKKSTAENHTSQKDDTNSTAGKEGSLCGEEYHTVVSLDVCEEEVAKLAAEGGAESEHPLNSQDQASPCSTGLSDIMQTATNDDASSHSDSPLPQEDKMCSDHNLYPRTPERTGPSLSDASGFNSGCNQEEEEVEVDVLLYSPDKVPQTREFEDRLDNTAITPDEEEEEDVNEIDVTGDEAE